MAERHTTTVQVHPKGGAKVTAEDVKKTVQKFLDDHATELQNLGDGDVFFTLDKRTP